VPSLCLWPSPLCRMPAAAALVLLVAAALAGASVAYLQGPPLLLQAPRTLARRTSSTMQLNRVFVEPEEVRGDGSVELPSSDGRFQHITKILKLEVGDALRLGIVNEGMTDRARLVAKNEHSMTVAVGNVHQERRPPAVDLLLAVPRPLRLERLLPVVACLGVEKLVLLDAAKVEKDYFGSHLFRRPAAVRAAFIEGLSQAASDFVLPELLVRRRLRAFLTAGEFDEMYPAHTFLRVIAHPSGVGGAPAVRFSSLVPTSTTQKRVVVAVGPEGGWEDDEIDIFCRQGFVAVSLGDRILRTDMAVPVLMGLAADWANRRGEGGV